MVSRWIVTQMPTMTSNALSQSSFMKKTMPIVSVTHTRRMPWTRDLNGIGRFSFHPRM